MAWLTDVLTDILDPTPNQEKAEMAYSSQRDRYIASGAIVPLEARPPLPCLALDTVARDAHKRHIRAYLAAEGAYQDTWFDRSFELDDKVLAYLDRIVPALKN